MTPEQVNRDMRRATNLYTNEALAFARWLYLKRLDPKNIERSFSLLLPALVGATIYAKRRTILASWTYMALYHAAENGGVWNVSPEKQLAAANILQSGMTVERANMLAPYGMMKLIGEGSTFEQARDISLGRAGQVMGTEPAATQRLFVADTAEYIPDRVSPSGWRRYRRVPAPGACSFCLMLASRGAVYSTYDRAKAGHFHCRCAAEPETNIGLKEEMRIAAADLQQISVYVQRWDTTWNADLREFAANDASKRPPDAEFRRRGEKW